MRTNKVRKNKKNRKLPISRGFPVNQVVKLAYEDLITLSPGTARSQYTFRGNSLFDPDYTGTGHQPRYFDQYAEVYSKYKVLSSSIVVELINGGGAAGVIFCVIPNTDILTFTSWPLVAEMPMAKTSPIVPVASRYPFRLNHSTTTERVCGLRPGQVNDEDWSATTGANPLQVWYWNVCIESVDTTTNLAVSFRVSLIFDAVLYERLESALS